MRAISMAELLAQPPEPCPPPWRLDRENLVLFLPAFGNETDDHAEGFRYYIDLERCRTSPQVLDWLAQVAGKVWADDEILAGLLRALDHVLHLQGTLCGMGQHRTLTEEDIHRLVQDAA